MTYAHRELIKASGEEAHAKHLVDIWQLCHCKLVAHT